MGGWQWNPPLKMNGFAYDLEMEERMVGWCRYWCVFNVFFTECAVDWTWVQNHMENGWNRRVFCFHKGNLEIVVFYEEKC